MTVTALLRVLQIHPWKLDTAFIPSFERNSKAGMMKPVYLDGPPGDHISLLKRVHNACNASCPTVFQSTIIALSLHL